MNILIYGINFFPELTGIGKYTGEMAFWLAGKGHSVTVVTAQPFYPAWKVYPGYSKWGYTRETVNGVDVIRCPLWVPTEPGGLGRIMHLLSFAVSSAPAALWACFARKPDAVLTVAPAILNAPMAWLCARLRGAKSWIHIQDFEVDAGFTLDIMRSSLLYSTALFMERAILKRFDRLSSISKSMLEKLVSKGVEPARTALFTNWVDTAAIKPSPEVGMETRKRLGIPAGVSALLYSGNFGKKQGIENIVEMAKRMTGRGDVIFVLCGDGVSKRALMEMAQGLGNVMFLPLQPAEDLNGLLNMADIHLLPQRLGMESLVTPSKLMPIMACGKPIIAMAKKGSELEGVLAGRGITVEPDDLELFHEAVVNALDNPAPLADMAKEARAFACANWETGAVLERAFDWLKKGTAGR